MFQANDESRGFSRPFLHQTLIQNSQRQRKDGSMLKGREAKTQGPPRKDKMERNERKRVN
jgi:hypothetical protein